MGAFRECVSVALGRATSTVLLENSLAKVGVGNNSALNRIVSSQMAASPVGPIADEYHDATGTCLDQLRYSNTQETIVCVGTQSRASRKDHSDRVTNSNNLDREHTYVHGYTLHSHQNLHAALDVIALSLHD